MRRGLISFAISNVVLMAFAVSSISAQDCPIRQTIAVKTLQYIGLKDPDQSGSSSIFGIANCEEALVAFNKELILSREKKNPFSEAWILTQLGDIYFETKRYDAAFDNYSSALAVFRQLRNSVGEIEILNDLASVSESRGDFGESLKYFDLLSVRVSEMERARHDGGRILDRIANIYLKIGDTKSALEHFNKRVAFEKARKSKVGESCRLHLSL